MDEILQKLKFFLILILIIVLILPNLIVYSKEDRIFSHKTLALLFTICKNNTAVLQEVEVFENAEVFYKGNNFGEFLLKIKNIKNESIILYNFSVRFILHGEDREIKSIEPYIVSQKTVYKEIDCAEIYLRFPFLEDFNEIFLYRNDILLFKTKFCNLNNICEEKLGENKINCEDCRKIKKTICLNIKDGICEENCPEDPDCKIPTFSIPFWIFPVSILVFSILLFIYFFKKSKISKVYPPKS